VIALTVDETGSAPGFLAWVRGEVGSRPG